MMKKKAHFYLVPLLIFGILLLQSFSIVSAQIAGINQSTNVPVIIMFVPKANISAEGILVASVIGEIKRKYTIINGVAALVPQASIAELKKNPLVLRVEPDFEVKAIDINADNQIRADQVWIAGDTGQGVPVAILDTGINNSHPEFSGRILKCHSEMTNNDSCEDQHPIHHGTHTAGIAGASGLNIQARGVAPNITLYIDQVLDASGNGNISGLIAGIDWATTNGAKVISMSLGTSSVVTVENNCDDPIYNLTILREAIDNATVHGVTVVAAAGNSGPLGLGAPGIGAPACISSTIAVGAVDSTDNIAGFSSRGGPLADHGIVAPGVNIFSTLPGGYGYLSGTSMATPVVSGLVALMIKANPGLAPTSPTNQPIRSIFFNTACNQSTIPSCPTGVVPNTDYGYGRVDALRAYNGAVTLLPAPEITGFAPSSPVPDMTGAIRTFNITINQTVNVTWYINGSHASSNLSVTEANYTNTSARAGIWNVSAIASNSNGSVMKTWIWNVTAAPANYNLSGYVTDKSSGLRLSSALVQTNTSQFKYTNATGFYNFTLGNGTYIVNASLAGYVNNSTTVTINASEVTNANISITPITITTNVTVFVRGPDNGLWTRNRNDSAWSDWLSLGGTVTSNISASSDAGGNITIFVRGPDNGLWTRNWNDSGWRNWQGLGGFVTSDPASVSSAYKTYVFVRGPDNGLWTQNGSGSTWSGWQGLGGAVTSNISASSDAYGNITIFVRGPDNGLWTRNRNGSGWSDWQGLGGFVTSDPASVSSANKTYVFVRGPDNGLWTQNGSGSVWSGWQGLGGTVTSNISASSDSGGNITIFVRGSDNGLWTQNWNGSAWSGWLGLGGLATSDPASISSANKTHVFVRGPDNGLWTRNGSGSVWSEWQGLGGSITGAPEATSG